MSSFAVSLTPQDLTNLRFILRCGPQGTRFPLDVDFRSRNGSESTPAIPIPSSSTASSSSNDNLKLSLSFGDDDHGAFLRIDFERQPPVPPFPMSEPPADDFSALFSSDTFFDTMSSNASSPSLSTTSISNSSQVSSYMMDPVFHSGLNSPFDVPSDLIWTGSRAHGSKSPGSHTCPEFPLDVSFPSSNELSPFPSNSECLQTFLSMVKQTPQATSIAPTTTMTWPPSESSPEMDIDDSEAGSPNHFAHASMPEEAEADKPKRGSDEKTIPRKKSPVPSSSSKGTSPGAAASSPTENTNLPFLCPVAGCNRRFARQYNFSLHLQTHEARPKKRFVCTVPSCDGLTFSRKHDLLRHTQRMHTEPSQWKCDWCKVQFHSSEELCRHVKIHAAQHSQPVEQPLPSQQQPSQHVQPQVEGIMPTTTGRD